jgi:hypothetical protein
MVLSMLTYTEQDMQLYKSKIAENVGGLIYWNWQKNPYCMSSQRTAVTLAPRQ